MTTIGTTDYSDLSMKMGIFFAYITGSIVFAQLLPSFRERHTSILRIVDSSESSSGSPKDYSPMQGMMHNPAVKANNNLFKSDILKSVAPLPHHISGGVPSADSTLSPVRSRRSSFKVFRNSKDDQDPTPSPNRTIGDSDGDSTENLLLLTPMKKSIDEIGPIVRKIGTNSKTGDIIVLGIAGGSGSGKTTLAKAIYESLGESKITYITHDSYYKDLSHLTLEEREQNNFDHPDSLDTDLLVRHIESLKKGEAVTIPTYDFATHSRTIVQNVLPPRPIVLVEGILIFTDPNLYKLIDVKIFVDTDDDIRLIRRIQRDTVERGRTLKGVIAQYINTVRPMHLQFVEPSKRNADIIVPVGLNSVALDLVVSKLKSVI